MPSLKLILAAVTAGDDPFKALFVATMAQGPCLCAEIDPKDQPCLTCEAHTAREDAS